jgi:AraC-like DNA-binding protein
MDELLQRMRKRVLAHSAGVNTTTAIPDLSLGVLHKPLIPETAFSEPMVCIVLQGVKQVLVGDKMLRYDQSKCFASAIELPATGCVLEADANRPFIAAGLTLDPNTLSDLALGIPLITDTSASNGFGVANVSKEFLEAFDSLLALLDRPKDICLLAAGRKREVLYELLRGEHGPMLRQSIRAETQPFAIRRVIRIMRERLDEPLSNERLATYANMSIPTFYRQFKSLTGSSPLQYLKLVRLHEARKKLAADASATRAAYAVGYESPSQFSREYLRMFGISPGQDAARMQARFSVLA